MSNLDLINKIQDRDPQILGDLFSIVNPILVGVLAKNGIFGEHAEDLIHQTWEVFFAKLAEFENRSKLQTFIVGILINKIREFKRVLNKYEYTEDSEEVFAASFTEDGWWKNEPVTPDRFYENRQLANFIQECLEGLTVQQRTAFMMIESEGLESNTVGEMLGLSVAHIRVLVFRAKDKLRSCLGGMIA